MGSLRKDDQEKESYMRIKSKMKAAFLEYNIWEAVEVMKQVPSMLVVVQLTSIACSNT